MQRLVLLLALFALSLGIDAATVTGIVVGPDGAPIAGADVLVSLFLTGERKTLNLVTDEHGGYAFEADLALRAQRSSLATLTVYKPGYALRDAYLAGTAGNVITLSPGASLHGTVVDEAGRPLAGVPVRLLSIQPTEQQYVSVPTEWDDRFTVATGADGAWTLHGISQGGSVTIVLCDDRYVHEQQVVKFAAGEPVPAVRFTARPGAVLTGRVLTPEGAPAANAMVRAYSQESMIGGQDRTATDGTYRITGLATGTCRIVAFSEAQEWLTEPLADVKVIEGAETAAPDLRARTGALLEGTVADAETGKPLPGTSANFIPEGNKTRYMLQAKADGRFMIRLLPVKGKVYVDNPPRGYLKIPEKDGTTVELQEGQTVTVTLKLRKGLTITGTAVDQDGNPAAGVPFFVTVPYDKTAGYNPDNTQIQFTTDEKGHFEASGLPAGNGILSMGVVETGEWEMPDRQLDIEMPSKEPLRITLTRKAMNSVTGRVVDAHNRPRPGVKVTFGMLTRQYGVPQPLTAVTGDDGRYTLANIPEGSTVNLLTLAKEGYCRLFYVPLTNGGQATIDDAVMAACDAVARGTVRDADGRPVVGATVVSAESGLGARAVTDAAGAFTLKEQPSVGELHLIAATPTGAGLATGMGNGPAVIITLKPGRTARPVDLEMAQELLEFDRDLPKDMRLFNRADTLRLIADIDDDLAARLAQVEGEPVSPGLQAYLLGKLAERDPAAAAREGPK